MKLPIDKKNFSKFIEDSKIFGLTRNSMKICLENWYTDDQKQFVENMRADFNTVMSTYHFYDTMVSFDKNFNFEPELDTITCKITINDEEDDYCMSYRAIFDFDLNIIDDVIS